jgi:hypothetical protein
MDGGPHWHKTSGYGGNGKIFHEEGDGGCRSYNGDRQTHIDGLEYRVVTVGDVIVQAFLKEHTGRVGIFNWSWVGLNGIRNKGIIPLIKAAIPNVPNWEFTIFGWDIMVSDRPYVLEINTSPGVNNATASRIVKQIERMV